MYIINGAVQKVKSTLKTKNHKHRYINVSKTLMGTSISRKNDLLDTPIILFCDSCFYWFDAFSFSSVRLVAVFEFVLFGLEANQPTTAIEIITTQKIEFHIGPSTKVYGMIWTASCARVCMSNFTPTHPTINIAADLRLGRADNNLTQLSHTEIFKHCLI